MRSPGRWFPRARRARGPCRTRRAASRRSARGRSPGDLRGDVGAELRAVERDVAEPGVGTLAGLGEVGPRRDHAEHPAPCGDERVVEDAGGSVRDGDAVTGVRVVDAGDRSAGLRVLRVALARQDDGHGDVVPERGSGDGAELPGGGGEQEFAERGRQAGEHDLRLRVAEPRVELDHADALLGDDEAAVQEPDERRALVLKPADRRQGHELGDLVDEGLLGRPAVGEPGQRRVRAHAARVRAEVAVGQALVVLRGAERTHVVAVAQEEQGDLFAVEELLDHDVAVLEPVGGVVDRGLAVVGDEHALAGGEPVGLDHVRCAELVDGADGFVHRAGVDRTPGGHTGLAHDPLGERLGALELGRGLARAEHRDAAGAHRVGHAGDERGLGAHDDELDVVLDRVLGDERTVGGVEGDGLDVGRDAGVAGRCRDDVTGMLSEQGRDDRVLAGTGTEDEDSHPITLPSPTRRPRCEG
ncbi:conserved hypothetical protein [Curtobacterium sp. 8I-2]|nr:conserved hypothetical protein [Curtobacterium sp. 8I-2]